MAGGDLRRIDRGLYDRPRRNKLTGRTTVPDYRAVIQAVSRRDNARVVIDGMTAWNDLGLTTAVPARIKVLIGARLKPIRLGNQVIQFKTAAPSRLFWAGRPAMRVVQALHWLQDMLSKATERRRVIDHLRKSPRSTRPPIVFLDTVALNARKPRSCGHLTFDLPLAQIDVALVSPKEAHRVLILDI